MCKSLCLVFCLMSAVAPTVSMATDEATTRLINRSPVDVAIARNAGYLVTANEVSDTVSLLSLSSSRVLDEFPVGDSPTFIEFTDAEQFVLVTCTNSGEIVKL